MVHPNVSKALEEARKLVAELEAYDDTPTSHLAALKQADRVRTSLQEPLNMVTHMLEQLSLAGAFHTILGIRAYHAVPEDGSSITADKLAETTNVATTIIQRVYRIAVNHGIFVETAPDTYAHNELSRALHPKRVGSVFVTTLELTRCWVHLPDYLNSHEPDDIFDPTKSPGAYSFGKEHLGKTYFELLELDPGPERREIWDTSLAMLDELMPIGGMFPFASLKEQVERDPGRPFLVDVGGGRGQSCFAIQKEIDGAFEGRFILQDLPGMIDALKPEDFPGIELMAHDAFTPQLAKNAHIYFMRRFLHDFAAPDCVRIVKNTASAMGPDSRLLICDMLIPDTVEVYENMEAYWLDFGLICVGGQEKTRNELDAILDAAGLEDVKVHSSAYGKTMMLEARLKK